ncbi:hypothetical protein PFISCL1PPCAC_21771, partial [Pristionchus fissidentatus]
ECRDPELALMNYRSISPLITQPIDTPAHFQSDSVHEESKILNYPANEFDNEETGSTPEGIQEKANNLLESSRKTREVTSKVVDFSESGGEKEEKESGDEDYEE